MRINTFPCIYECLVEFNNTHALIFSINILISYIIDIIYDNL